MARTKKIKSVKGGDPVYDATATKTISDETLRKEAEQIKEVISEKTIAPIAHEFGNGDMNVLRDKINEIIKHLS